MIFLEEIAKDNIVDYFCLSYLLQNKMMTDTKVKDILINSFINNLRKESTLDEINLNFRVNILNKLELTHIYKLFEIPKLCNTDKKIIVQNIILHDETLTFDKLDGELIPFINVDRETVIDILLSASLAYSKYQKFDIILSLVKK